MLTIWPPPYTLKPHPRARHVKLKASLQHGLLLIVPMRFNAKSIPSILERNKKWIEKNLKKIQLKSEKINQQSLGNEIHLKALNQIWSIHPIKTEDKKVKILVRPNQELVILGHTDNRALCQRALLTFIKNQASDYLVLRLKELSKLTQLNYEKVIIRGQATRWGSCSTGKSISLNYKLIFLDDYLVNHVLIHELCHTIHMNHSSKFWRLVASFDPKWKENASAIRNIDMDLLTFGNLTA